MPCEKKVNIEYLDRSHLADTSKPLPSILLSAMQIIHQLTKDFKEKRFQNALIHLTFLLNVRYNDYRCSLILSNSEAYAVPEIETIPKWRDGNAN